MADIASFVFGKPLSGIANIADIVYVACFVFAAGKPRLGIADITDIPNIASFVFGKPWLGFADIADIASLVFGKPRSGIADIADIADIVSIAFGEPRSGNTDIASFAFCKARKTTPSSDICEQGPTVQEPWGGERHSCSYRNSCA